MFSFCFFILRRQHTDTYYKNAGTECRSILFASTNRLFPLTFLACEIWHFAASLRLPGGTSKGHITHLKLFNINTRLDWSPVQLIPTDMTFRILRSRIEQSPYLSFKNNKSTRRSPFCDTKDNDNYMRWYEHSAKLRNTRLHETGNSGRHRVPDALVVEVSGPFLLEGWAGSTCWGGLHNTCRQTVQSR